MDEWIGSHPAIIEARRRGDQEKGMVAVLEEGLRIDPNLTNPMVLNASINATLLQPTQPWFANVISTFITAVTTILAVYLGQRWTKKAEKERNSLKAQRQAYLEYMKVFSEARKYNWTPSLISEKLPILLKTVLETAEHGDIKHEYEHAQFTDYLYSCYYLGKPRHRKRI